MKKTQSISKSQQNPELAIELKAVEFSYAQGPRVLNIQQLEVKKGECVFIYGPSGSGKTTLLGILAGVLQATKGVVRILNKDLTQMSPSSRDEFRGNDLGYVFQMFNLIPYLNVKENITLSAKINAYRRNRIEGSLDSEAQKLAAELGLSEHLNKEVTQLSVGQQQRVAVARALLGKPGLLIADEPTSALDFDHREKFLKLLFEECKQNQTTLLFVSHDRTLEHLFDRSIALNEVNRP